MNYIQGLNDRQKQAVLHTEGPLLIVAGAGAGKTKTITHRIAHMMAQGVAPHRILAVTFTNKAAGEMRDRIRLLLPERSGMPVVATFHSLGVRLLREFHEKAGIERDFSIWDRDDSMKAIKRAQDKIGSEEIPARSALAAISREKGEGRSVSEYEEMAKNFRERAVSRVWREYEKALAEESALDFDDLLLRTLTLLRSSEETLSLLRDRFSYITIDEYQDTNRTQYEIARLMAGDKKNICVVGDIDQNIYSWRGADIEHLLRFEETFPGASVVLLEQNYRSTRTILSAANAVIAKNTRRKPKNLFTENETGEPIALYGARNEVDEAWFVAQMAQYAMEKGTLPDEIVILYRENFQSRALEEALLHFGVPYRVIGTRFFDRKEVKDMLSYMRAAINQKSKVDLTRAVATPSRGIGKVTLDKMLSGSTEGIAPAAKKKIDAFKATIAQIRHAIETLPPSETVRFVAECSGMEEMYKNDTEEGRERLENIRELVNLATRYDSDEPKDGIQKLLEEAALQADQDELETRVPAVSLMTVHASKGLEFDVVFVTGLEQGLFPSTRESSEARDSEEERRLFYVAMTRARKRLLFTYAGSRLRWGSREFTIPSEFLDDIDPRLVRYATVSQEDTDGEEVID